MLYFGLTALLLSACSMLPVPVNLGDGLGDLQSGSYSFELPASFENLNATFYLPGGSGEESTFEPPNPAPTSAKVRYSVDYEVLAQGVDGLLYITPYFAPDAEHAFDDAYALGEPVPLIIDGGEHTAAGSVELTPEQLSLLSRGKAVTGIKLRAVDLNAPNGTDTEVTFNWSFNELVAEVGIF